MIDAGCMIDAECMIDAKCMIDMGAAGARVLLHTPSCVG